VINNNRKTISTSGWNASWDEYDSYEQLTLDFLDEDVVKCECGAEKVYGKTTTHSFWCPKYIKDFDK
jgi:hypothetical protein